MSIAIASMPSTNLLYSHEVILEVLGLLKKDAKPVSISEISRVLSRDPSLTAKLLGIANSPVFSGGKVNNIEQAVFVLGMDTIRIISMWILFYETNSSLIPGCIVKSLREHASKVAIATVVIGQKANDKSFNRCVYFLAGLLHDIGRMIASDQRYLKSLSELLMLKGLDLLRWEEDRFYFTHPAKGKEILNLLCLPEEIVLAAAHHHDYGKIKYSGKYSELISSVYLAENLLSFTSYSPGDDGEWLAECEVVLKEKKLNDSVVLEIEQKINNLGELFFV